MQKLQVKTLECTEQSSKIGIPQGGEGVSCSVHMSFNVNSVQKELNFRDIYALKKLTRGFFRHPVWDSVPTRRDLSIGV